MFRVFSDGTWVPSLIDDGTQVPSPITMDKYDVVKWSRLPNLKFMTLDENP